MMDGELSSPRLRQRWYLDEKPVANMLLHVRNADVLQQFSEELFIKRSELKDGKELIQEMIQSSKIFYFWKSEDMKEELKILLDEMLQHKLVYFVNSKKDSGDKYVVLFPTSLYRNDLHYSYIFSGASIDKALIPQNIISSDNCHERQSTSSNNALVSDIQKNKVSELPKQDKIPLAFKLFKLWTDEEDKKLIQAVKKHGLNNWSNIARLIPGRSELDCDIRWTQLKLLYDLSNITITQSDKSLRTSEKQKLNHTTASNDRNGSKGLKWKNMSTYYSGSRNTKNGKITESTKSLGHPVPASPISLPKQADVLQPKIDNEKSRNIQIYSGNQSGSNVELPPPKRQRIEDQNNKTHLVDSESTSSITSSISVSIFTKSEFLGSTVLIVPYEYISGEDLLELLEEQIAKELRIIAFEITAAYKIDKNKNIGKEDSPLNPDLMYNILKNEKLFVFIDQDV